MKVVLISVLLFFELCSGLSVQKLQLKRSPDSDTEAPSQTDVYEVDEGNQNTVTLTHPKPEKPTLREIIYYHLIEYPYETQGGGAKKEDPADAQVTEVSDNNGNETNDDDDDEVSQRHQRGQAEDEEEEQQQEDDEQEDLGGEEKLEGQPEDETQKKRFKLDVRTGNGQAAASDHVKEHDPHNTTPCDKKKDTRTVLFDQAKTKYVVSRQKKPTPKRKREISYKNLPAAPTLPPLNLGSLPEYIRRLIANPGPARHPDTEETERSKTRWMREYMAGSADEGKEPTTSLKNQLTHFDDEEEFSEELEKKINEMISSLKPEGNEDENQSDEDDDDDANDDSDDYWEEEEDEDEEDSDDKEDPSKHDVENENTTTKLIPRTFGMNLTVGRGYVWNDLLSAPGIPGISFDMGESADDSENTRDETTKKPDTTKKPEEPIITEKPEETKIPNASEIPTPFKPFTNVPLPTENRPIYNEDSSSDYAPYNVSSNDKNTNNDNNKESPNYEDLEDIDISNFKPKLVPDDGNSEQKKDEHIKGNEDEKSIPITTDDVAKNKEQDAEEYKPESNKETHSNHGPNHKKDKHKHKKTFKPENDDSLKELMKNEEFWKWLDDWTSTYMELLFKHIKGLVHDEVSRQIKALALDLKKDIPLEKKDERESKEKDDKSNSYNSNSNQTKDLSNSFTNDDKIIFDKNSTPHTNPLTNDDNRIIDRKTIPFPDNNTPLMPFTHTTNFDVDDINATNNFFEEESNDLADFLKNKKHKSESKNKKKSNSSISISATNIFGNAAGSDKVTNIFVFYPSNDGDYEKDDASILSSITPTITGVNNIFVSGKQDKIKIDERFPEISKQKDESTMTEKNYNNCTETPIDDIIKPSNMLEKDKDIKEKNKDQESQTEPPTTTPKHDVNKEIEQVSKALVKEKTTDQSKVDNQMGLSQKDKIGPTTESAHNTESTTVLSSTSKEQEDIKPIDSENIDKPKVGNKTDTESPVTDNILYDKTEITSASSSDKKDTQDETENKSNQEQKNITSINTENKDKLKDGNKTDTESPVTDNILNDKTEIITAAPSDKKDTQDEAANELNQKQEDIKPLNLEKKEELKAKNITEYKTDTEMPVIDKILENKTEITSASSSDKKDTQNETENKSNEELENIISINTENKDKLKDGNKTDTESPVTDNILNDKTEITTAAPSDKKDTQDETANELNQNQEDIKPLNLEKKDKLKAENKTESKTDTEMPVIDKILENKTEITTTAPADKKERQDETEHKEHQSAEHPEKLKEEQIKEIEAKVEKELKERITKELEERITNDLKERITKELETNIKRDLQAKIEQDLLKLLETEQNKARTKEIDKHLEEPDKGVDKLSSEKNNEEKKDDVVVAA